LTFLCGKIVFLNKIIPIENYKKVDILVNCWLDTLGFQLSIKQKVSA
jgi:hypothetical protein